LRAALRRNVRLSSGKAAELAGLSRADFFEVAARYRVSAFNCPAQDLEADVRQDLKTLERLAGR